MKTLILSTFMIGLAANSFGQDIVYQTKIKKDDVPVAIIASVETDFPGYAMEEFSAIPLEYVEDYAWVNRNIKSIDDYDTFDINLSGRGKEITATYDRNGNLLGSTAHVRDALPPPAVRDAVVKAYPGWTITKDVYNMTQYKAGKSKEHYRMEIMKDGKKMHIYTDANGTILNASKMNSLNNK